jgi:quinol monooxygenase YgiN
MMAETMDDVGRIIAVFAVELGDSNLPFALIAPFRVRKGEGPGIEEAFAEASAETAGETGVLAYQLHREADDPDSFVVYERWRSLEDLEAHLRTAYIAVLRAKIDAALDGQPSFQVMVPT